MEDYVKKSTFQWTIGIMIVIIGSVFSYSFGEVKEVRGELNAYKDKSFDLMTEIRIDVAKIVTKFENYELAEE